MNAPSMLSPYLWRGARPDGPTQINALKASGVVHMLDLQGDWWETLTSAANHREMDGWLLNLPSTRIALNSILPPHRDDVGFAHTVMAGSIELRRPLYVHCRRGVDRTGYVIAAWRMSREGWSYERAVGEMIQNGFHRWYFYWLPRLRQDWSRG